MIKKLYSQLIYDHQRDIIFYLIYALILIGLLFTGLTANISASSVNNQQRIKTQQQAPTKTYPLYDFNSQHTSPNKSRVCYIHYPDRKSVVSKHNNTIKPKINSHKSIRPKVRRISKSKSIAKLHARTRIHQNSPAIRMFRKHHAYPKWFRDGLDKQNLSARDWVSFKESGHKWNVISYGHRCIGYFQLDPNYLGYKNGHVNLNHRHQIKVADQYAFNRYGDWVHAKAFWQIHHWY